MTAEIDVVASDEYDGGWIAAVAISDAGTTTRHRVRVERASYERFAFAGASLEELVRASFEFLLERESKESILAEFEIGVIAQYFPEYEQVMRARLDG